MKSENDNEKLSGIYLIKNMINNKIYVGRAKNINNRWKGHIKELNRDTHKNTHMQSSWNKYGEENFKFEVFEIVESLELSKEKEKFWIKHFKSFNPLFGYNKTMGGEDGEVTEEIRKKMSEMVRGEKNPFYGKSHTKEFLKFNRENQTGIKMEESVAKKIKLSKSKNFKHFTQQEINDMVNRKKNGETYKEINKIYKDVSLNSIRKIILENDPTIEVKKINKQHYDNGNRKLTSKQVLEIVNLLEDGYTYKILSEKYNVSTSTIKRVRMGIGY